MSIGVASGWVLLRRSVWVAGAATFAALSLAFALEFALRFDDLVLWDLETNQQMLLQMLGITSCLAVAGALLAMGGARATSRLLRRG